MKRSPPLAPTFFRLQTTAVCACAFPNGKILKWRNHEALLRTTLLRCWTFHAEEQRLQTPLLARIGWHTFLASHVSRFSYIRSSPKLGELNRWLMGVLKLDQIFEGLLLLTSNVVRIVGCSTVPAGRKCRLG